MKAFGKSRILVLITLVALAFAAAGCGFSTLSEEAAQKKILKNLEKKYKESFTIESFEKAEDASQFRPHYWYRAQVKPEGSSETFEATLSTDGKDYLDGYEELLYSEELEGQAAKESLNSQICHVENLEFRYEPTGTKKCKNSDEYKTDHVKLYIDIQITGDDADAAAMDIYDYVTRLRRWGFYQVVDVKYGGSSRIIKSTNSESSLDAITETIHDLMDAQ